ncbi:ubiquinone biosynthesis monooxygenase Coq7 [Oceanospirillum multiglobuliferum]|uniref:3-demethoxyubiquinol 3-hydroxylase n=1 Tax=Oceanospirillum multiglobuliferum TaxID=64969 RepID=A0A1T4Q319_9GAMM|nr:2-polyprenyl-3-methyl-6-methoxy-1,4-benzoquinone monooxygenase [Oceanospirillum multiglobuliferum]OPX55490.1 demethoxyubiquinone hydroxylase family protein [Oceanospirillum multiglobuliferum]SJZ97927.1 ubiquinone biosynthesis monooxygenase Coq7 [Oceanospirillum multiglobuliferum]
MNSTRQHTPLDKLLISADTVLKTLIPGAAEPYRVSPARQEAELELSSVERKHAAGLMRINHTGEVCAQALYQGQALTAKLPEIREQMDQAAREEIDHLAWCEQRIRQLGSRPSLLNPVFYGLSFGIGAMAGAAGDQYSLGFVAATEQQVCKHLEHHLQELPSNDKKSRAVLEQMYIDEEQHAEQALSAGGIRFPTPVKLVMKMMSKVMTKSVYHL